MNSIGKIDWAKLKVTPLDEHMPDPVKEYKAWLAKRAGLWFWAWDSYWDHWAEREEAVRQLKAELGIK